MADDVGQILAVLGALQGQLNRVESRMERVEGLDGRVAVLERVEQVTAHHQDRFWAQQWPEVTRALEDSRRALSKVESLDNRLENLRGTVNENREAVNENREAAQDKANAATMEAVIARVTELEGDRARREGYTMGQLAGWTVLTASPGLIGLVITIWKLLA